MSEPEDAHSEAVLYHVQTQFIKFTPELRALVSDSHRVDDLMHSVFLAVTKNASTFDRDRPFLPWARRIARNKAVDAARQSKRTPIVFAPDVIAIMAEAVPELTPNADKTRFLSDCINEHAPRAKTAITLRYYESLKPAQSAPRMALAIESVNVMLSRARTSLRKCVERKLIRQEA